MSNQEIINILLGAVGVGISWAVGAMRSSLKDLTRTDENLKDKITTIEVLIAGNYVKRDEFHSLAEALFKKLDSIENKLDRKADKP